MKCYFYNAQWARTAHSLWPENGQKWPFLVILGHFWAVFGHFDPLNRHLPPVSPRSFLKPRWNRTRWRIPFPRRCWHFWGKFFILFYKGPKSQIFEIIQIFCRFWLFLVKNWQFLRFLSKNCSNRMLRCSFQAFAITRNDSEPSSGYFRDFGQNNRFWPTVPYSPKTRHI